MRQTLEDLYYGSINPSEQNIRSGSPVYKAMEQSEKYERQLTLLLEGEKRDLLLRLLNAENEIGAALAYDKFIDGFRLGARLMLEVMDREEE